MDLLRRAVFGIFPITEQRQEHSCRFCLLILIFYDIIRKKSGRVATALHKRKEREEALFAQVQELCRIHGHIQVGHGEVDVGTQD